MLFGQTECLQGQKSIPVEFRVESQNAVYVQRVWASASTKVLETLHFASGASE